MRFKKRGSRDAYKDTVIGVFKAGLLLLASTQSGIARNLGVYGQTFEIREENLLHVIQQKLQALEESGKLLEHQEEIQQRIQRTIERPLPVEGITKAIHYTSRFHDPSVILEADIKDHEGRILGKKGTRINPLDHLSFGEPLILIDGDEEEQVQWALSQQGKIVLVKGAPLELTRLHQKRFYFDQGSIIVRKFGIEEVPTRISQRKRALLVETILPEEKGVVDKALPTATDCQKMKEGS